MRFPRIIRLAIPISVLFFILSLLSGRPEFPWANSFFNLGVHIDNPSLIEFLTPPLHYLISMFICLGVYEGILICLDRMIYQVLEKNAWKTIFKGRTKFALWKIRVIYHLEKMYLFIRLWWFYGAAEDGNKVWSGLQGKIFPPWLRDVTKDMLILSAFVFSVHIYLSMGADNPIKNAGQDILENFLNLKLDVVGIFSSLPLVLTIITLLPTIFFFYFYSQKRDVRKIVCMKSNRRLEESVLLYEELIAWIDQNLYKISENYNCAILNQEHIVELRLKKIFSNYSSLKKGYSYGMSKIDDYGFQDIDNVEDFSKIVNGLLGDNLVEYTWSIAVKKYDIWEFYNNLILLGDSNITNRILYTRSGMVDDMSKRTQSFLQEATEKMLDERRKSSRENLAHEIYANLKKIYVLKHGSDALRKYLYSSRAEKVLVRVLQKEKQ